MTMMVINAMAIIMIRITADTIHDDRDISNNANDNDEM